MNSINNLSVVHKRTMNIDLGDEYVTVYAIGKIKGAEAFVWNQLMMTEGGASIEADIVTKSQITERIYVLRGDQDLSDLDHEMLKLFFD